MNSNFSAFDYSRFAGRFEGGAVLFVALIFLVLLTLLALTASSTSILQERMTGGMRDGHLADMGADSALRAGEVDVWTVAARSISGAAALPPCGSAGYTSGSPCAYVRINGNPDSRVVNFRTSTSWLSSTSDGAASFSTGTITGQTGTLTSSNLATAPRYLVEDLGAEQSGSKNGRQSGGRLSESGCPGCTTSMHLYRITGRSQGSSANSMRAAESVFGDYSTNNQYQQ